MQNNNTITQTQNKVLFPLGQIFLTVGAQNALEKSHQLPNEFLAKHQTGDWGMVCEDDRKENERAVTEGFRILSVYKTEKGEKLWIITEADRSSSTILKPDEY